MMLGYMTKKQAIYSGMTHHGSYYCIPVWMAPNDPDFLCCAKWYPFEFLISMLHDIEGFFRSMLFPYDEACFQFKVGEEIKK